MSVELPEQARSLIDGKNFAHLATVSAGGAPQVTPVWVARDGDTVIVNTAEGRVKTENMRRDSRVAISITDSENPYAWAAIQGIVQDMTTDGADDEIDSLAKKYLGQDTYPFRAPDEVRVSVRIAPEKVALPAS